MRTLLELDGQLVGEVFEAVGGHASYQKADDDGKASGSIVYDPITFLAGFNLRDEFYAWVSKAVYGLSLRKDGALIATEDDLTFSGALDFYQAVITSVTLPRLDGAKKERAFLKVTITPGYVKRRPTAIQQIYQGLPPRDDVLISNFRVTVGSLPTRRVAIVAPITIDIERQISGAGDEDSNSTVTFSHIELALAASDAQPWLDWHHAFVVEGDNGPDREIDGAVVLLDVALQDTKAVIKLTGLGAVKIRPQDDAAHLDKFLDARLYCRKVGLQVG